MAKIFGILTAIVLAVATYAAYKNQDALKNEISHRKHATDLREKQDARKAKDDKIFAATEKERKETQSEVASLRIKEADLVKTNNGLTKTLDEKSKIAADNKAQLDSLRAKVTSVDKLRDVGREAKELRAAIEGLEQDIVNDDAKIANLNSNNEQVENTISILEGENKMHANRESFFSKARITSIYPQWGFVTIGAGTTSGVVDGSTLEIIRDGTPVGKLLVTRVERSTSAASIVPDSLAKDTVLMVGDVVAPTHKQAPLPPKPAPAVPKAPAADAPAADAPAADPSAVDPAAAPAADADPFAPAP